MSSNSEEIPGLMGMYRRKPKLVYTNQGKASRKKQRSEDVKDFPEDVKNGRKCSRERNLDR